VGVGSSEAASAVVVDGSFQLRRLSIAEEASVVLLVSVDGRLEINVWTAVYHAWMAG